MHWAGFHYKEYQDARLANTQTHTQNVGVNTHHELRFMIVFYWVHLLDDTVNRQIKTCNLQLHKRIANDNHSAQWIYLLQIKILLTINLLYDQTNFETWIYLKELMKTNSVSRTFWHVFSSSWFLILKQATGKLKQMFLLD
jgi:hypothetical protein